MDNFAANVKNNRAKNNYWIVDGIEEEEIEVLNVEAVKFVPKVNR